MKKRIGTVILTGALVAAMALPVTATSVFAGRGGGKGQSLQTHTRTRDQHRLRDGSCLDPAKEGAGTMRKKGNTYGPGDGTGNMGDRPMDGTGYGAPSQR
jgi:hypothetical protein